MSEFEAAGQKWKFDYELEVWKDGKWTYVDYSDLITLTHSDTNWVIEFDGDYQGDYFAIGQRNDGKWLFLQGSYGSCSGCDWLQGLNDLEDAKRIVEYHQNRIIVKDTKEEIITYITDTKQNAYWAQETIDRLIVKLQTNENNSIEPEGQQ